MHTITIEVPGGVPPMLLAVAAAAAGSAAERIVRDTLNVGVAVDTPERDLTRAQELAADAMASLYGRSRVEHRSDGAVVITGMLDDIEKDQVCVEQDGRERWRRR